MNKSDLAQILGKKLGLRTSKAEKLITSFGDTVCDALGEGKKVVYSNFGTFHLVHYPSKMIYHPILGKKKKIIMLPTNAVKWLPSDNIKDIVALGKDAESITGFGASKKMKEEKKREGISETKAQEISKEEFEEMTGKKPISEEAIEIPIRIIKKTADGSTNIRLANEIEIKPFSDKKRVEFVDLEQLEIPAELKKAIPQKIALTRKVIPLEIDRKTITLGMVDPYDEDTIDLIRKMSERRVIRKLISETALTQKLKDVADSDEKEISTEVSGTDEPTEELKIPARSSASRIFDLIMKRAIRDEATSIHFDRTDQDLEVKFRQDSDLIPAVMLAKSLGNAVLKKVRGLAGISEDTGIPQSGIIPFQSGEDKYLINISSVISPYGEKIVANIKNTLSSLKKIGSLDLRTKDLETIRDFCRKSAGLALIIGPKESGKTTMIYAIADQLQENKKSVFTAEKRIGCKIKGVNQTEINEIGGYSAMTALEIAQGLDADAVLVSDQINILALKELILMSQNRSICVLEANSDDVFEALESLRSSNEIDQTLIAGCLKLIINQRLVRKLCPTCGHEYYETNQALLRAANGDLQKAPSDERNSLKKIGARFYRAKGCKECRNTGYIGKLAIYEILSLNTDIEKLIIENKPVEEIKKAANKYGFITKRQDGLIKALAGLTSLEEIYKN